ncbi:MAG: periplasmic heavy metal sensor [Bacteroidota bacterium]|jgi:Spy/CpxP family protein refolding chaperone
MNYFNKYRLVFWIMILMILINISAFTSFFVFYKADRTTAAADTGCCSGTCRVLNEKLSLSSEQAARVSAVNRQFREKTEPVVAEIKNTRVAMLNELSLEKPDTAKLSACIEKIGELQKILQKAAVVQFRQLKEICTAEQCRKLSSIYSEVYGCSKMGQGGGEGMQNQRMPGQENKACDKNQ